MSNNQPDKPLTWRDAGGCLGGCLSVLLIIAILFVGLMLTVKAITENIISIQSIIGGLIMLVAGIMFIVWLAQEKAINSITAVGMFLIIFANIVGVVAPTDSEWPAVLGISALIVGIILYIVGMSLKKQ